MSISIQGLEPTPRKLDFVMESFGPFRSQQVDQYDLDEVLHSAIQGDNPQSRSEPNGKYGSENDPVSHIAVHQTRVPRDEQRIY